MMNVFEYLMYFVFHVYFYCISVMINDDKRVFEYLMYFVFHVYFYCISVMINDKRV